MFDSASVNSISSMPSPVYQWRKALRRNMAENWILVKRFSKNKNVQNFFGRKMCKVKFRGLCIYVRVVSRDRTIRYIVRYFSIYRSIFFRYIEFDISIEHF